MGSARREAQRKRYRDVENDVPTFVPSRTNNFQSQDSPGVPPQIASAVPPVPLLSLAHQIPLLSSETPHLTLS